MTTTNSRKPGPATEAESRSPAPALAPFAARPVAVVVVALAVVLAATADRYGYHRDELYFRVAGQHLAWGYVDQPPVTPLLAHVSTALFGDTLIGLRIPAILLGCAATVVVALLAREFGAERRAQTVAAACAAASAFVLGIGHMLSTESTDLLSWLVVSFLLLRVLRTGDGRWYLAVGAAVGLGMLNKWLIALLAIGLLAGVLLIGPRKVLCTWWLAAGVGVALLLALPNLWWAATHGWPEFAVAGMLSDNTGAENRVMFFPLQVLQLSPLFVPVWVAGLIRLWRDPGIRWARSFPVVYLLFVVLMLVFGGKSYYVLPLLMVAMAAGAAPVTRWVFTRGRRLALATTAFVLAAAISAVVTLPLLPVSAVVHLVALNKDQGDQLGWPQFVGIVARAWDEIPPAERSRSAIVAQSYGETGAVDRFGPQHGLPQAYSGHMSFYYWGAPPNTDTGPVVVITPVSHPVAGLFVGCRVIAKVGDELPLDNELDQNLVELCAAPAKPWSRLWPSLRHLD